MVTTEAAIEGKKKHKVIKISAWNSGQDKNKKNRPFPSKKYIAKIKKQKTRNKEQRTKQSRNSIKFQTNKIKQNKLT